MSDKQISTDAEIKPFDVVGHLEKIAALAVDHTVKGRWGVQAGLKHLLFNCPNCTLSVAISGPGKIVCPHCARVTVEVQAP